ncbi:hypothetical protein KDX27_39895 [Burkholderia cenocepacia]|uniref:hypothetical protein n=1 Tax=Burkholderia cenocepacia TaxID=95486 RepID=UPI001B94A993|nr:hypothetical protein [Burkholderia cenocepacia]MBR8173853.1 hypothetical protein [Burkholderia cenocepacia]
MLNVTMRAALTSFDIDMDFDDEITLTDPIRWKVLGRTVPTNLPLTAFLVIAVLVVSWMTYVGVRANVTLPTGRVPSAAAAGSKATAQPQQSSGIPKIGTNSSLPPQASAQLRRQFYFAYLAACRANAKAGTALFDNDMNSQLASQKLNTAFNMGISYSRIDDTAFSLTLTGNIPSDVLSSAEYAEISQYGQHVTPDLCANVTTQIHDMADQQGAGTPSERAAPAPSPRS